MSEKKGNLSKNLTVLVFKDQLASRSFQIPLSWISRLGVVAAVMMAMAILGGFLAVKYYMASRLASPARVRELERELQDLKASLAQQEPPGTGFDPAALATATPSGLPSEAVSPTLPAPSGTPAVLMDRGLLGAVQVADPATVPIRIQNPKAVWYGKSLSVFFAIQYHKEDGEAQQGRIVVLAKSGDTWFAYPGSVLGSGPSGGRSVPDPERGEYFSVSRYREVHARLGPVPAPETVKQVEIYLFDDQRKVLIHHILRNFGTGTRPAPQPSVQASPQPDRQEQQKVETTR